jgi:hypothetical protein
MGAVVMIRDAESSFEAETAAGYTKYVLSANGESDFSVKSFMFTVRGASAHGPAATTPTEAQVNAPTVLDGDGFVFDTLTIALIAAGGALCLIIVVVLVIVLARRRKSRASPASDNHSNAMQSTSSGIVSGIGMEMRPALSRVESSLVVSETAPPPYATLSSVASDDKYLPLAIEPMANNQYQSPRGPPTYHAPAAGDRYGAAAGGSGLIAAINSAASYEALPMSTPPGQAHVGHYRGVPRPDERLYNVVDAIDGGTYEAGGSGYMPLPQQPIV